MDIRVECPTSRGSGTAVGRASNNRTLILTNCHVIDQQPRIMVYSGDGRQAAAAVVESDQANDLALLVINQEWPYVNLGDEVSIGSAVQFRAFDAGIAFRKYYGQVSSRYQGAGAGGFFATGASRSGNSGGGVYSRGRLVGVVWGNPNGGTAFVPIGPVRRLINLVLGRPDMIIYPPQPQPIQPATPSPTVPDPGPADEPSPTPRPEPQPEPQPTAPEQPGLRDRLEDRVRAAKNVAGVASAVYPWVSFLGPIAGGGLAGVIGLLVGRRQRRGSTPAAGSGVPADQPFRERVYPHFDRDDEPY